MLEQAELKKLVVLVVLLACVGAVSTVSSQQAYERHVHVADGGLVFISDTIPLSGPGEVVKVGFPADGVKNLVGYYLLGERGTLAPASVQEGVQWLELKPETVWTSGSVTVVTVWRDMFVESAQNNYLLVIPSNPVMERKIDRVDFRLTFDGSPTVTSVSGEEMGVSGDKKSARGEYSNIEPKQFKTVVAYFENPDLLRYTVETAEVRVDISSAQATMKMMVKNTGRTPFSSLDVYMGKDSEVLSVSRGLARLSHSWDADRGFLRVEFDSIGEGQRVALEISFRSRSLVEQVDGRYLVEVPRYLNTTFSELLITVATPPADQVSFSTEPWTLRIVENNRRIASFRFENLFIPQRVALSVSLTASNLPTLPTVLVIAIAVVAGFQALAMRQRQRKPSSAELAGFSQSMERLVEEMIGEINRLKNVEDAARVYKTVEDRLKTAKETLWTAKKSLKGGEIAGGLNSIENQLNEAGSILQAVNKTVEDFKANRIPRNVYTRVVNEYVKECRKTLSEVLNTLEYLSRLR
ncbi:MAG: hypothetical protein QXV27_01715 [Candidatus Caldarchaeum sp.]